MSDSRMVYLYQPGLLTMIRHIVLLAAAVCALAGCLVGQERPKPVASQESPPAGERQYLFNAFCGRKPILLESSTVELSVGAERITQFSITNSDAWSLRYALLVDTSGSTRIAESFIKQSVPRVVQALASLKSDGYFAIFTDKVVSDDASIDSKRVSQLLSFVKMSGTSALYDALVETAEMLPKRFPPAKQQRYAMFALTDAVEDASSHSLRNAVDASRKRGVPIFPIILVSVGDKKQKKAQEALLAAAAATAGAGLLLTEPEDFSKKLVTFLKTQQVLTFKAAPGEKGVFVKSSKCDKLDLALIPVQE